MMAKNQVAGGVSRRAMLIATTVVPAVMAARSAGANDSAASADFQPFTERDFVIPGQGDEDQGGHVDHFGKVTGGLWHEYLKTVATYSNSIDGGKIKGVVLKSAFSKAAELSATRIAVRLDCFGDPDGAGYKATLACAKRTAMLSVDIAVKASGGGIVVSDVKKVYIDGYVYEAAFKVVSESMYAIRRRVAARGGDEICIEGLAC